MRFFLPTVLIISFVSIAVFGFVAMNHRGGNHFGCVASTAKAINCSNRLDTLAFISFHFGVLKSFSAATTASLTIAALLLISALAAVLITNLRANKILNFLAFKLSIKETDSYFAKKQQLIRWLAIHENSPSFE